MELSQEAKFIEQAKIDREAFGRLYEEHYDRILNYILRRTASLPLSQDITSEVFFKALHNIHRYQWNGVPFSAWLYRIASSEIANHFRKENRRQYSELESVNQNETVNMSIEDELIQAEEKLRRNQEYILLQQRVSQLPLRYQEVIALRYFERKQLNEIGQILGKKDGTIRSLLHRGLEKLRQTMQ